MANLYAKVAQISRDEDISLVFDMVGRSAARFRAGRCVRRQRGRDAGEPGQRVLDVLGDHRGPAGGDRGHHPVRRVVVAVGAVRVAAEWVKSGVNEHIKTALEAETALAEGREGGRE